MKTNNSQKTNQTSPNIPNSVPPIQTVEKNNKILPFLPHNKKSLRTLPIVLSTPNKVPDYNILTLPSPNNRRPLSYERSRSNKNASYQSKHQLNKLSHPAHTLHTTNKNSKNNNTFILTNPFSSDPINNNNIDYTKKTKKSENINKNKSNSLNPKYPTTHNK